jgi:hypothetical protein
VASQVKLQKLPPPSSQGVPTGNRVLHNPVAGWHVSSVQELPSSLQVTGLAALHTPD